MGDAGDISTLLEEDLSLADLDWLDVDEEEYRKHEKLPEQNLDAVPDLQDQWSRLSEGQYSLHPNNQEPGKKNTPFWSEKAMTSVISEEEKADIVEQFMKRKMSAGMKASSVLDQIKSTFDRDTIRAGYDRIKEAFEERGLLGFVYVDASLYPDCHQGGEGVDQVKKANKLAKYVKAKDRCVDCRYAENGRCSVFQKELVFDVQYDNTLWDFYKKKLEAQGLDLSNIDEHKTAKAKLRTASLNGPTQSSNRLDSKPIQLHDADKISYEEASEALNNADLKREVVANVHRQKRRANVSEKMLEGEYSKALVDELKTNPDLADLNSHRHLMGSLYADLSWFSSKESAAQYHQDHPELFYYDSREDDFSLKSAEVLRQILHRYAINQYGTSYGKQASTKEVLSKVAERLVKSSEEDVRAFARGVYAQVLPTEAKQYEYRSDAFYDPTEGLSYEEAEQRFAQYEKPDRERVKDQAHKKAMIRVAERMAAGNHSQEIKSRIAAEFDSLAPHMNLLGNLYYDSRLVNPDDFDKRLPVLSSENQDVFFKLPEVQDRIIDRYARTKALSNSQYAQKAASLKQKLESLTNKQAYKFARSVFSKSLPKTTHAYETKGNHAYDKSTVVSDQKVSRKDVRDFYRRQRKTEPVKISFQKLASRDQDLVRSLVQRVGREEVIEVFGKDNSKVASLEKKAFIKQAKEKILKTALDPDFESSYHKAPDPILFQTKMGRWMRDKMHEGLYGDRLVTALRHSFSNEEIVENAPVIIALREQEGLYGRAYSTAGSYDDCFGGTKQASSTVDQVVADSKCVDCVYNKTGHCALYSKKLVSQPEYSEETVRKGLNHRLNKGQISTHTAKAIHENEGLDTRQRTKLAYAGTSIGADKNPERYKDYNAYRGSNATDSREKKAQKVMKIASNQLEKGKDVEIVMAALEKKFGPFVSGMKPYVDRMDQKLKEQKKSAEMLRELDTGAPSGLTEMEEMELVDTKISSPLDDFDIEEPEQDEPIENISLEGITL